MIASRYVVLLSSCRWADHYLSSLSALAAPNTISGPRLECRYSTRMRQPGENNTICELFCPFQKSRPFFFISGSVHSVWRESAANSLFTTTRTYWCVKIWFGQGIAERRNGGRGRLLPRNPPSCSLLLLLLPVCLALTLAASLLLLFSSDEKADTAKESARSTFRNTATFEDTIEVEIRWKEKKTRKEKDSKAERMKLGQKREKAEKRSEAGASSSSSRSTETSGAGGAQRGSYQGGGAPALPPFSLSLSLSSPNACLLSGVFRLPTFFRSVSSSPLLLFLSAVSSYLAVSVPPHSSTFAQTHFGTQAPTQIAWFRPHFATG